MPSVFQIQNLFKGRSDAKVEYYSVEKISGQMKRKADNITKWSMRESKQLFIHHLTLKMNMVLLSLNGITAFTLLLGPLMFSDN